MDLLFKNFVGEYVRVSLTRSITDKKGMDSITIPLTVSGFLLDQDSNYLYLGNDAKEISMAIERPILFLEIAEQENIYDDILNNMPDPKKKEEIN